MSDTIETSQDGSTLSKLFGALVPNSVRDFIAEWRDAQRRTEQEYAQHEVYRQENIAHVYEAAYRWADSTNPKDIEDSLRFQLKINEGDKRSALHNHGKITMIDLLAHGMRLSDEDKADLENIRGDFRKKEVLDIT